MNGHEAFAVTGGTGFIGSRLVDRLLAEGYRVRLLTRNPAKAPSHPRVEVIEGDLTNPDIELSSLLQSTTALFHCAGELQDPAQMHSLHVDGTRRLVEAARGIVKTWIQLSSVGVYGEQHNGVVTESYPYAPIGPYEQSKSYSDQLVEKAAKAGAFRVHMVRPANVIGNGMPNPSLNQLIGAVYAKRFVYFGPPGAITNYLSVENLVDALILGLQDADEDVSIYMLSDPCPLEAIIEAICDGLQIRAPQRRIPLSAAYAVATIFEGFRGFPLTRSRVRALSSRVVYSSEKLKKAFGYTHQVPVTTCVKDMAGTWKKQHEHA